LKQGSCYNCINMNERLTWEAYTVPCTTTGHRPKGYIMKKQIESMGIKARTAILKTVDAESKAYASQQTRMMDTISTIETHFGVPEKATGYVHTVHNAMLQAGRDVPEKYTEAIQDKGECGRFLKRLYDFIRNSGDNSNCTKEFNVDSYVKAVMTKCAGNEGLFAALEKAMKEAKKAGASA